MLKFENHSEVSSNFEMGFFQRCLNRFSRGNAFLCNLETLSYAEKNWELRVLQGCPPHVERSEVIACLKVRTDSNCMDQHLSSLS